MKVSEKLRFDLQTRKNRVLGSTTTSVISELGLFFEFVNNNGILSFAIDELRNNLPKFDEWFSKMQQARGIIWPDTELERVKLCLVFLEKSMDGSRDTEPYNIGSAVNSTGMRKFSEMTEFFLEQFFMPLYEYLDSKIEEHSVVLYILQRFKFKVEWFEKGALFNEYQVKRENKKGEEILDLRLREYLFDQGIDYPFSQARSPSGKADVLSNLDTNDPLVLEVKIFDPEIGYNKSYIKKGFVQSIKYCDNFHKDVGYLVVFNPSASFLRITTKEKGIPPRIISDGKKIFIIIIDILPTRPPASKESDTTEIKEEFLLKAD